MGNIWSNVEIKPGAGDTEGNSTVIIEFLDCIAEVYGTSLSIKEQEMFKKGVLAERERVWDKLADLLDKETLSRIKYEELFQ